MAKIANMPSRESLFMPILKAMISKGGRCFVDDVLKRVAKNAEIVDWGYPTVDELLEAWGNVEFENLKEFM